MDKLSLIINTEQLLKEVGNRPVLWDINNEQYKDRDVREEIWIEIAKVVISNYVELSETGKENAVRAVQKRWKSCRDHYVHIQVTKKPYIYARLMTFLDSMYKFDEIKQARTKALKRRAEFRSVRQLPKSERRIVKQSESKKRFLKKPVRDPLNTGISSSLADCRQSSQAPQSLEGKLLKIWQFTNQITKDEDLSFFYSLLPTMRQLDFRQKLVFKRRIMELLEESLYSETFESKPLNMYYSTAENEESSPEDAQTKVFVSSSPNSHSAEESE